MKILSNFANFFILKDYQNKEKMTKRDFTQILLLKLCLGYTALIITSLFLAFVFKEKISSAQRPLSEIYFSAVILAPFLEELFFRFPLLMISKIFKKFEWVVMFSYIFISMFFGLVHITNYYNFSYFSTIEMVIITLPQILAGFVLGWVCLKYNYGLLWCILLHASYNFITVTLSTLG